ncbi:MAG: cysteine synthase family protein [Oscillospiraceae bacterium]|nr:cysteine synthase family protein [Oscillospiraceae bacterium]
MNYYNSMQGLIGNTPLVKLNAMDIPSGINVFAKLELYNPSGSVKDRIGKYMVDAAERDGLLTPGGAIIDATAGNTGLGIAFAALGRGYRIIFVVPTKFSAEKQTLLRSLGAEVINTPLEDGMLGASKKADELRVEIPGAITLDQFKNMTNPLAHYEQTGPEIYRDMDGQIDYLVAGAGSGGTFSGVMKYLKEQNPNIQGVLADPVGSTMGGGEHANYNIEGIGNDFIADTMDMGLVDHVVKITDQEAFDMTRLLAKQEGIIAGSSSGAAMAAVKKFAVTIQKGNIITIFPDRGDRYFSKGLYKLYERNKLTVDVQ